MLFQRDGDEVINGGNRPRHVGFKPRLGLFLGTGVVGLHLSGMAIAYRVGLAVGGGIGVGVKAKALKALDHLATNW